MIATNIEVRKSLIHGQGVYALQAFKAGETVVPWENTKEISEAEREALPARERRFTDIQNGKILLVGIPERYVNHSCEANTKPGKLCDIAIRDIAAGEEITANYGNFFILDGQFQCRCGSEKCRGIITGKK